jgi:hypothetical protein
MPPSFSPLAETWLLSSLPINNLRRIPLSKRWFRTHSNSASNLQVPLILMPGYVTPDGDSRDEFDQAEMEPSFYCSSKVSKVRTHSDRWQWKMWDIKYCLSEPVEGKSSLNFNLSIIVVVILCNMGKSPLMFFVAIGIKDDPLVTIGDAVGSFLKCNDPTTEGMCLVSKEDIEADECVHFHRGLIDLNDDAPDGSTGFSWLSNEKPEPIRYQPSVKRWLKAASGPRWWACALLPVPRYPP